MKLHRVVQRQAEDSMDMVEVMMTVLEQGIQPLKAKEHSMYYMYTREDDITKSLRAGYYERSRLARCYQ